MSKQITYSFTLTVSDETDASALYATLRAAAGTSMVETHFISEAKIQPADRQGRRVWIYVSPESLHENNVPFLLVNQPYTSEGAPIEGASLDYLFEQGVCDGFYAECADVSRNGAPHAAVHRDYAIGEVAEIGFAVDVDNFTMRINDRGDDGSTDIWLSIVLPASTTPEQFSL